MTVNKTVEELRAAFGEWRSMPLTPLTCEPLLKGKFVFGGHIYVIDYGKSRAGNVADMQLAVRSGSLEICSLRIKGAIQPSKSYRPETGEQLLWGFLAKLGNGSGPETGVEGRVGITAHRLAFNVPCYSVGYIYISGKLEAVLRESRVAFSETSALHV